MENQDTIIISAYRLGKKINKRILYNCLLKDTKLPDIKSSKAITKTYLMGLALEPNIDESRQKKSRQKVDKSKGSRL